VGVFLSEHSVLGLFGYNTTWAGYMVSCI